MQRNIKQQDSESSILISQASDRTFTDDELRAMSKAFRTYIGSANRKALRMPEGMDTFLNGRVITSGDKTAAIRINSEIQVRITSHIRPESFLNTTGGHMHHLPKKVTIENLNGVKSERPNSAIPAPFGISEKRDNVQAVTAVAHQLVTVKGGTWETNVPVNTWTKMLPRDGGMNASGMESVADSVVEVLNGSRTWRAMDTITRSACTGLEALSFIRTELDNIPEDDYDVLNTRIVYNLLCPFEREDNEWYERVDDQDRLIVPETSYKTRKVSSRVKAALFREGYPEAYWYYGGYAPMLNLPINQGRFKETLEKYQKMMESQVGNNSCTAILFGMKGYSGLTDDFGKRIQFTSSAILTAWKRGFVADVQLKTTGDIVMLKSTVTKWANIIRKGFEDRTLIDWNPKVIGDVAFILPKTTDLGKVPQPLRTSCIFGPRENSVLIVYNDQSLPTAQEKGQAVDYQSCAKDLLPSIWRNNELIAYMPIYDEVFFSKKQTDDSLLNSSKKVEIFNKYFVYHHFAASNFRGVLSTFDELNLIGYGFEQDGKKWREDKPEKIVDVPLEKCPTFSDWLKKVSNDCSYQILCWLRPISRYCPISNLPQISRKGVQLLLTSMESEDGELIANASRLLPTVRRGRKVGVAKPAVTQEVKATNEVAPPPKLSSRPRKNKRSVKKEDDTPDSSAKEEEPQDIDEEEEWEQPNIPNKRPNNKKEKESAQENENDNDDDNVPTDVGAEDAD